MSEFEIEDMEAIQNAQGALINSLAYQQAAHRLLLSALIVELVRSARDPQEGLKGVMRRIEQVMEELSDGGGGPVDEIAEAEPGEVLTRELLDILDGAERALKIP